MLRQLWLKNLFICVGLDSAFEKIPQCLKDSVEATLGYVSVEEIMFQFNKNIIKATADLVCAFKLNIAFYEAQGNEGMAALIRTIAYIKEYAPEVPIILDAKRADIGNTNDGYVKSAFDIIGADAITVNPFFGKEAMEPFLKMKNKGIIILCRTSNSGSGEFQDLEVNGEPLYQVVARRVVESWNDNSNCAVVVGATQPEELEQVRMIVGDMPILIPGVGAQGADVKKTVNAGGREVIIHSARKIIFASDGPDYAEEARTETVKLGNLILICMAND
ncbi:MAG: orotidine-5'-phosphate decarboxylase [Candidatus Pacebacteria bacterium]|nr:orotidine-5'-phosphate decarboxylase [Candidatus Paceibacterota bacterium]